MSNQSVELLNEFHAEDVIAVEHKGKATSFKHVDEEKLSIWKENAAKDLPQR